MSEKRWLRGRLISECAGTWDICPELEDCVYAYSEGLPQICPLPTESDVVVITTRVAQVTVIDDPPMRTFSTLELEQPVDMKSVNSKDLVRVTIERVKKAK